MWSCVSFRCALRACYAHYKLSFEAAEFTSEGFQVGINAIFNDFAQKFIKEKDATEITEFNVRYYKISLEGDHEKVFQIVVEGRVSTP